MSTSSPTSRSNENSLPAESPAETLSTEGSLTEAELLSALEGTIAPARVSLLYRFGLLLASVTMLVLVLVYGGLIVVGTYGLWSHLVPDRGTSAVHRLLGEESYFLLCVLGPIISVFLIKPLFAPRGSNFTTYPVTAADHPTLFRFVERLCGVLRAPVPRLINVDLNVNASASFRRGFLGLLSNNLVLTIGLPLVRGLTLPQLTGVISHEFGHFTQGSAMRLTYIVRRIDDWFARVVYQRDKWDQSLLALVDHMPIPAFRLFLLFLMGLIWLTRRLLWILMWIGHLVSSFMLRQMEYDADRCEARVVGNEVFAGTMKKLPALEFARQLAWADLQRSWLARRLADDLPRLVVAKLPEVEAQPAEVLDRLLEDERPARARIFDTHPTNRQRLTPGRRDALPGTLPS